MTDTTSSSSSSSSSSSAAGTVAPFYSRFLACLLGHGRAYATAACLAVVTTFLVVAAFDPGTQAASSWFLSSSSSSSTPSSLHRGGGVVAGELLLATSTSYSSHYDSSRNSTGKDVREDVKHGASDHDDGFHLSSLTLVNSSSSDRGAPDELSVAPAAQAPVPEPAPPAKESADAPAAVQAAPRRMQRSSSGRRRRRDAKLERLERGLAKARAAILDAIRNSSSSNRPPLVDTDYVPVGPIYRNAYAFHRSYLEMEKRFKVFVYEEGEPPAFHDGPCRSIYSTEGRFIHTMETLLHQDTGGGGVGGLRTNDPDSAHVFFLPFSVVKMVKTMYEPGSHDMSPIRRAVADYVGVVSAKHRYWNRSRGADHFMLSCHDWGPYVSSAHAELASNAIRVLCNANTSEGFDPTRDVSLPEVNLRTDVVSRQVGGPSASHRPILAFFAGGNHGPVRPVLLDHWSNGRDPDVLVSEYLPSNSEHGSSSSSSSSYTEMMRRSRFCLCPGGYEVASPRLAEAVYLECVPVVVDDGDYALPFADVLNWDAFSLRIRVKDIPRIKEILSAVSPRRYIQLKRRVAAVRRHFMVHRGPPRRYDAFHMVLHSVWLRRLNVRVLG